MSGTHDHLEWSFGVLWACQLRVETPTDQEKLAGFQTVPYRETQTQEREAVHTARDGAKDGERAEALE